MKILNTLSHADLQKFAWLLTQIEANGIRTLSDARLRVENKLRTEHNVLIFKLKRGVKTTVKIIECPECRGAMDKYLREDLDGTLCTIIKCRNCQFSELVGGTNG